MRALVAISMIMLMLPISAQQPVKTFASEQLREWVLAFSNSDPSAFRTFIEHHYPSRLPVIAADEFFRKQTGGFELQSLDEHSTPSRAIGIVRERKTGDLATIVVEVSGTEPFNIRSVLVRTLAPTVGAAVPRLSRTDFIKAVKGEVDSDTATGEFSGAILVAKDGIPILSEAAGYANRTLKTPNTVGTQFRVGSIDKMFTAVAILQMVEAGRLQLGDPVGRYLTDYPNKELARKVTIRQLLSHTGGTGDIFGPEFQEHRTELRSIADYVQLYGSRPLAFEPGTRYEYSNYGFILLGAIIERVSGESYYTYVQKHIFDLAGMSASGFRPESSTPATLSIGYTRIPPSMKEIPNSEMLPYRGTSAGGGYSSVGDLLRFAEALQSGQLLKEDGVHLLTTARVDTAAGHYGYGFDIRSINGVECFGHDGGAPGMSGELQICPAIGLVAATLENIDPPAALQMTDFITSRAPK